jgi:amidase
VGRDVRDLRIGVDADFPFPPPTLAEIQTLGEQPELISKLQRFTCPFDLTGNPTVTLPGGFTHTELSMGFQLVAAGLQQEVLVRAGATFQKVTSWHRRHPVAEPRLNDDVRKARACHL